MHRSSGCPLSFMKLGERMADMRPLGGRALVFSIILWIGIPASVSAAESPHAIGYFCNPDEVSIVEGQYYEPQLDPCFYLSTELSGFRLGELYRGTVGSSTRIIGHGLGSGDNSFQFGDGFNIQDVGVEQGEDMFVAIYQDRGGIFNDAAAFGNFFTTSNVTAPHQNYGFIRFKYGTPPAPEPDTPDPVVIIPGILGSEQHDGEWIIDPILHAYDDLIATLDVNGYTPDVDLFTFPYNWRKSNVETAILLKQRINEVKSICDCDKVDLVAHSMGGLVARQYIQSDAYEQDVDQLIFLGTPHLGSPDAYLMWEAGEVGPFGNFREAVMERILKQEAKENGYTDLFNYIHTAPISSVPELLPTYSYIFDNSQLRDYPSNYPINTFLETLNANVSELTTSGVAITNIVGNTIEQNTITGIHSTDPANYLPKWSHGYPQNYSFPIGDHGLLRGSGDGTVPLASASFINSNLLVGTSTHRSIPTNQEGDVFEILTGEPAVALIHDSQTDFKLILIKALSPIDFLVVDPSGNKIGKENGQEVNQIPGAFYTGFNTDTEFITILNPLDGEYKVITEGTGSGAYTVETTYISEATTTEVSFTGNTTLGLITELNISIDNENPILEIVPTDVTSPIIIITSPEARDYLHSEQLPVNVTAQDAESGVQALGTALGTTTIPSTGAIDLFFLKLGSHMLTASSTDNVGNATTSARAFRVVTTASSTISDIDRAYSLGWMTQAVYNSISKKFKATIKFSKLIEKRTDGKPNGVKIQVVLDKVLMTAMLVELQKYRGKGLNEQGYQLLREDIIWLINH